jgi:hypothetical protein
MTIAPLPIIHPLGKTTVGRFMAPSTLTKLAKLSDQIHSLPLSLTTGLTPTVPEFWSQAIRASHRQATAASGHPLGG